MIENIAFHFQVEPVFDLDRKAVTNKCNQGFLDHATCLPRASSTSDAILDAQLALLDLAQFLTVGIFKAQGLAYSQSFANY